MRPQRFECDDFLMFLSRQQVPVARVVLILLFVVSLLVQFWAVPSVASQAAAQYPEYAQLSQPYTIAVGIAIGFFELALIAAWRVLASAANANARRQRVWATIFTVALASSGALFAAIFVHTGSVEQIGGPPMLFGLVGALAVVTGAIVLRRRTSELTVGDAAA
jgi:hypothetical protein